MKALILASSRDDADRVAVQNWGWRRATINGRKGWHDGEGRFVTYARSESDLVEAEGAIIYFGHAVRESSAFEMAEAMVLDGRAKRGQPAPYF